MSVLLAYSSRNKKTLATADERAAFLPLSAANAMSHVHRDFQTEDNYRWSGDSGQGTEPPSPSEDAGVMESQRQQILPRSVKAEPETEFEDDDTHPAADEGRSPACASFLAGGRIDRYLSKLPSSIFSGHISKILTLMVAIVDRTILPLAFAVIATGGVTYGGIMVRPSPLFHPFTESPQRHPSFLANQVPFIYSAVTRFSTALPTSSKAEYSSGTVS